MRNKIILLFLVSSLAVFAVGCKKKKAAPPQPDKAILTFPIQNSACTTGAIISETQSSITFTWNPSANATSYDLHLKNLLSGVSTSQTVNTNEVTLTLARNTPYSWYIISKSDATAATAQSDTWKFYNSGAATVSHAPFPADIVAPTLGQNISNNKVNLSWAGSDADSDIVGYDVYFGTTASPAILKNNVTSQFLNDVNITSGTTYYWKIVTKDSNGNTSDSALFHFKVN